MNAVADVFTGVDVVVMATVVVAIVFTDVDVVVMAMVFRCCFVYRCGHCCH